MSTKDLLKRIKFDNDVEREIADTLGDFTDENIDEICINVSKTYSIDTIVTGKVVNITDKDAIINIGYKSEGIISLTEFDEVTEINIGDEIEVLLEAFEDNDGIVQLSKRKADRIRGWENLVKSRNEGDVVSGKVIKKIKGGLLVDIGIPVFLPASQVDVRRLVDIADFIDQTIECKIIKIDHERKNIVVSRRKLLEEEREAQKKELIGNIEVGSLVMGIVKNITDFGAFVDLGAMDGLLHITDITWGRVSHPSEILKLNQEIECVVLDFDKERERISLGLKQKTKNPWINAEEKYPPGKQTVGTIVNIVPYGAFVKLDSGIEGLVHISEMSWTKKINHPSEILELNQEVNVIILDVKADKQQISLGIKQLDDDPWANIEERYAPQTTLKGTVRNLTTYGAFIQLEEGIDGLLHVSDISWTKKITHPNMVLKKGDEVDVIVLLIEKEKKRIALGMKQLEEDPWEHEIVDKFQVNSIIEGVITKITNFGVFIELQDSIEGLMHISELASEPIASSEEVLEVGQKVKVSILNVDQKNRKIGLSMKALEGTPDENDIQAFRAAIKEKNGESSSSESEETTSTEVKASEENVSEESSPSKEESTDDSPAE
ncbi:MAG: 30S ribosomal protein S1 [Planctomycetota bacterium]|nr:MAG: 30S ribosomal protein S1 [Planctomycetota bacterium]